MVLWLFWVAKYLVWKPDDSLVCETCMAGFFAITSLQSNLIHAESWEQTGWILWIDCISICFNGWCLFCPSIGIVWGYGGGEKRKRMLTEPLCYLFTLEIIFKVYLKILTLKSQTNLRSGRGILCVQSYLHKKYHMDRFCLYFNNVIITSVLTEKKKSIKKWIYFKGITLLKLLYLWCMA